MFNIIKTRLQQKYRTFVYPDGPPPELPPKFTGRPVIKQAGCRDKDCKLCITGCPVQAIHTSPETNGPVIDTGKCIFCRVCERVCPEDIISFSREYRLAVSDKNQLIVKAGAHDHGDARHKIAEKLFKRSLKLRQVSAGGCNACEADTNVLGTLAWDMGRFGMQFVASPRHADGILITGPVSENMREALLKTYRAVPEPKVVIATGACAISGGPYADHPEQHNGAFNIVPVDLFIPGCPPHPLTILDGLLRFTGRII
jgi:Ni,Fe-hydrogenase III small subunit/formate hydrogenlyase subunit 6/NADH:ubiquinone oxidoreductase subunit I